MILEQYAILLVRVSLGLFFAISGANKLFVAGGRKTIYETLVKAKVPFRHQMAYFVSGVEFVGGSEQLDLLNEIFGGEDAAHSPRYGHMGAHSPQCEDTAAAWCC